MSNFIRIFSIVLLIFTGLNALIAGSLFIYDLSGQKIGMTLDYLKFSPFNSFLIPGIILFLVNGVSNLLTAFITIKRNKYSNEMIVAQGILLAGWILIQVWMVRDLNPLHIIMFSIGAILITCGIILIKQKK